MIDADGFIEWCNVHGNKYGTSKNYIKQIQDSRKIPLLDIDIQGTYKFLKAFPQTRTLFIFPPSVKVLKERLTGRGDTTEEAMVKRLANAVSEVEQGNKNKDKQIGYKMVNKDIEEAKKLFVAMLESLYPRELH